MVERYPFKNLVFQGGGVRAFAYHGVIAVLEEEGILSQIERVGGSSAGALTAMLVSFRRSAAETIRLFNSIDFQQITSRDTEDQQVSISLRTPLGIEDHLRRVRNNVYALNRLFRKFGWYTYDYFQSWLHEVIADHCDGNPRATFQEFRERGFLDLHVVATNISRRTSVDFCAQHTPHVAVADAVVMSGLIPLYFEAVQFDGEQFGAGDYFADGGVMENYPIHIFDYPRFSDNHNRFVHGVNWETLGCRLYTPEELVESRRDITNILEFMQNTFEAMVEAQQVIYANSPVDQLRSINISDCGVSTTDFFVIPGEHPKYEELVASGRKATQEYLERYRLPTDRFFDVKMKFAEFLELWRRGLKFR